MNENHNFRLDRIPFIDLAAQRSRLGADLDRALARVFQHGQYIMGPEVGILERELASFCGASEVITCANGTDALELVLRAKDVGNGQAVLCPSFTFAATAEVVVRCGATPVFIDVLPDGYSVDPASISFGVRRAVQEGLRPTGLISVDLFGQAADYEALGGVCAEHGLWLLADAAQSFGAADPAGRRVGSLCAVTTTSFYPAK
ncbi:MAG: DegT/DnrJ/EryC1/StrS family aminotransferase, partial [Variibacter sp.]|nr:DegT/DnrJ/EryC1/StrS family aminotransferase [Variibacter sp.]